MIYSLVCLSVCWSVCLFAYLSDGVCVFACLSVNCRTGAQDKTRQDKNFYIHTTHKKRDMKKNENTTYERYEPPRK